MQGLRCFLLVGDKYGIYCYLTGTDWELMWLGVGLREGDCVIFQWDFTLENE